MSEELLHKAAESSMKKDLPDFKIGDTVKVHVRIVEGEKERVQIFVGTVIARRGGGISETFTVRRIVNNEGVERIFPLHSPKVADIEVVRSGKVRRAKLHYLRDRVGKSTRLKEVRPPSKAQKTAPETRNEDEPLEETASANTGEDEA
ncbi:MAG TPA: 50S ribosomal protein L19 [Phycisphaerae bacterium]|nr:50S ribosomal protein L19 [Phycisphaerae bacterium]